MTLPVLLTALTPLSVDRHPLHRATPDCHATQRPGHFNTALLLPRTEPPITTTTDNLGLVGTTSDSDDTNAYPHTVVARQWSGAPIRAIAPLPRRKRAPVVVTVPPPHPTTSTSSAGAASHAVPPANATGTRMHAGVARATRWNDTDIESEGEIDLDDDDDDDDVEVERRRGRPAPAPRYCAYESITAAEGLVAWSFEELRVECYAQSLVARGATPSPVAQPSLAIPPAFVPRIVARH